MITLESTKIAFDTWRTTRAKSNTPTPRGLWDMVKQLLPKHRRTEIYKTLGINSNQIKKHCGVSNPLSVTTSNNQKETQEIDGRDFVTAIPLPISGSSSELTLKGSSRSLHLRLPTAALRDVLPVIGELL